MSIVARIIVTLTGLICSFIMWLEMFSWEKSGKKIFPEPEPGYFHKTVSMAANQGLYNGFLGAGMIWSAFMGNREQAISTAVFFLACMIIAGIYGAVTVAKGILIKQAAPAAVALTIVLLAG